MSSSADLKYVSYTLIFIVNSTYGIYKFCQPIINKKVLIQHNVFLCQCNVPNLLHVLFLSCHKIHPTLSLYYTTRSFQTKNPSQTLSTLIFSQCLRSWYLDLQLSPTVNGFKTISNKV